MIRRAVKTLRARARLPGWTRAARRENATIILCYHRFEATPGADPLPGMSLTAPAFARQLQLLAGLGPIVSLDDALRPADGLRFALTFDDGYADNLHVLVPLLETAKVPATVFCTADFVGGALPRLPHDLERGIRDRAPLTPDELRTLARHPLVTIGAHGASHCRLDLYEATLWQRELAGAKAALEGITGKAVEHFAYPFGGRADFDWSHGPAAVSAAGFRSFCSNYGGHNVAATLSETPVHLRRVPAIAETHPERFLAWVLKP